MPKSSNQKLKLIYLMKILLERTDETHSITMPEIIEALASYDISAERKSLYNDIENLAIESEGNRLVSIANLLNLAE